MFLFGYSTKDDWFFSSTIHVYQRVNEGVYCYVSKAIGFYMVQMYERSTTGFCTLEARSETNIEALFELGEKWLNQYKNFDMEAIKKDKHYIGQLAWKENCWVE